jgi:nucleoside-diphosphate kinase
MKERTFVILKPDCMEKNLLPEVMGRFLKAGLTLVACKMAALDEKILAEHYAHIVDKPFYPPLVKFMMRRPVVMGILEGDNAVARVRKLLGCTNSLDAPAGTIRGDFGLDTRENIAHASDSVENAQIEINRFFKAGEIFDV